jgi:hypothetical protein
MGMVIHDDFWEAAQAMPEKHRPDFIYALVAYKMGGVMPKGRPAWLPTFIAIKDRLDMGTKTAERARKAANARWHPECSEDAQASSQSDAQANAQAYAQADADAYAQAQNNNDAEDEYRVRSIETPL